MARTALVVLLMGSAGFAQTETVSVNLDLRTGGALSGPVVDHDKHGLVIVHKETPYVFAWSELKGGSAYAAKRALLVLERGSADKLSAADHFQLGSFALANGRNDLAANEFRKAEKRDPSYKPKVREAFEAFRRRSEASLDDLVAFDPRRPTDPDQGPVEPLLSGHADDGPRGEVAGPQEADHTFAHLGSTGNAPIANRPPPEVRAKVSRAYRTFGEKVREVMGRDVELVETDHFLIWTDWPKRERSRLSAWCESMYSALCEQFDLDPRDDIFLAKCPVFCFRTKDRFRRFAREFDGYDGTNAIGYTRSIEKNGHVHMVLARPGRSEADLDRLACTLVHEGTHAFLHRLYSTTLIPHWVNEGYAELIADRVLGDRCPGARNAALLAKQYVRYEWSIGDLLESVTPLEVSEYALAHTIVAFVEGLGRARFAEFIKALKSGQSPGEALAASHDGMTLAQLEKNWRSSIRKTGLATAQPGDPNGKPTVSHGRPNAAAAGDR